MCTTDNYYEVIFTVSFKIKTDKDAVISLNFSFRLNQIYLSLNCKS